MTDLDCYRTSVGETPAGTTMMEYIDGFKENFEAYATEFGKKAICKQMSVVKLMMANCLQACRNALSSVCLAWRIRRTMA